MTRMKEGSTQMRSNRNRPNTKRRPVMMVVVVLLAVIGTGAVLAVRSMPPPAGQTPPSAPSDAGGSSPGAPPVSVPQEPPAPDYYVLPVLGRSNKLTATAWESMVRWRDEMIPFAKVHQGRVFLNGPNQKRVALTFDDGPDPTITPMIADTLKRYGVKGSFFVIGTKAKQYPQVVKQTYDKGNLILGHSYTHDDLTTMNDAALAKDFRDTEMTIASAIGHRPALMRTPFGAIDDRVVTEAERQGTKIVLWSIDTLDWSQMERANIVKNAVDNVRNGDIILMHCNEDKIETAKAVPLLIEALQKRGYELVDVATLLDVKAYKD